MNNIRSALERKAERFSKELIKMKRSTSRHSRLVDLIEQRLNNKDYYDHVGKEDHFFMAKINYKSQSPIEGECDIYAIRQFKKRYLLVFEIKCNNTTKASFKAVKQLNKDEQHYKQLYKADRVWKFYVHGVPDIMRGDSEKYVIKKI